MRRLYWQMNSNIPLVSAKPTRTQASRGQDTEATSSVCFVSVYIVFRGKGLLGNIAGRYMDDPIGRLRTFIQLDYSIDLRGLAEVRIASSFALYSIE